MLVERAAHAAAARMMTSGGGDMNIAGASTAAVLISDNSDITDISGSSRSNDNAATNLGDATTASNGVSGGSRGGGDGVGGGGGGGSGSQKLLGAEDLADARVGLIPAPLRALGGGGGDGADDSAAGGLDALSRVGGRG